MLDTCNGCKFYVVHRKNARDLLTGSCKRFPPSPVVIPEPVKGNIHQARGPTMRMAIKAAWVTVLGSDCCGEHKANDKETFNEVN